jgi:hypothetical protein
MTESDREYLGTPKWLMRLLLAGATTMVILGARGFTSLGLCADALAYYTAGLFLRLGLLDRVYEPAFVQSWQAQWIGPYIVSYLYPPAYSLVFLPLGLMTPWPARLLWLVVSLGAGIWAVKICMRWSEASLVVSILALLAFPPFAISLATGQTSPISLLLFSAIASLEWQGKRGLAAGFLAALALFKPQLLIPLGVFWIYQRRWKTLIGFGIGAALVSLVSLALSYPASLEYGSLVQSFFRLAENTKQTGANTSFFAMSPWLALVVAVSVIIFLFLSFRQGQSRYAIAMLWLAPVLLSPYLVTYDLLLLILPLSFLAPILNQDRWLMAIVICVYLAAFLAIPLMTVKPIVWAALFLFGLCAWRSWHDSPAMGDRLAGETSPGSPGGES